MKIKISFLPAVLFATALVFSACGGGKSVRAQASARQGSVVSTPTATAATADLFQSLDELAALERAGSWFQGLGLTESSLRENAGDSAGAVAAAYKELAWAYGKGLLQKEDVEHGLLSLTELKDEEAIVAAANAVLAFSKGRWETALGGLEPLFDEDEDPDGFGRWMMLVCKLETNREDRRAAAAYKTIRARYTQFPEYWYRGARAFTGTVAAEYAENCINISPFGPFADDSRKILAVYSGLRNEDGSAIRTKAEIDFLVSQSLNTGNPALVDSLFPLINLPDNPYTIYAISALRALNSIPMYKDFFTGQAAVSRGRLAERLSYISRS